MSPNRTTSAEPLLLPDTPADTVTSWLGALGFAYNPFAHIHAEADPHLADYWMSTGGHLSSHEASVLIFGLPGSGKTTKRLRLQREMEIHPHLLPVPFVLPATPALECQAGAAPVMLPKLVVRAIVSAVFLHCLRHAHADERSVADLVALARMFDAWLPVRDWRNRVREAAQLHDWSDVLGRLNAEHMPVSDAGSAMLLQTAGVPGDTNPPMAVVLPAAVKKVILMADDFDADALRTPAMTAALAAQLWKMRFPARRSAQSGAAMFDRVVLVSVQLYLPQAARAQVLRRIKTQPEIYVIAATSDDLLRLANQRIRAACPRGCSFDALMKLCGQDSHLLVAQAEGSPRRLVAGIRESLRVGAEAWRTAHAPRVARQFAAGSLPPGNPPERRVPLPAHRIQA